MAKLCHILLVGLCVSQIFFGVFLERALTTGRAEIIGRAFVFGFPLGGGGGLHPSCKRGQFPCLFCLLSTV